MRAAALLLAAAATLPLAAAPAKRAPVDPSMAAPVPTTLKGYLSAEAVDGVAILGPPPAPDSPRGKADRAAYLETRAFAGSPRWTQATKDNDLWNGGALERFACAIGRPIDGRDLPRTYRLLQRVELDSRQIGLAPKDRYQRVRPLIGDDRPVCIKREAWMATNGSYPSGHAMTGWAWGLILAELSPAHASSALDAGRQIGESRVICGVHYQSDVEAGRMLGAAVVAEEHASPAFRADLAAAKAELARGREHMPAACPTPAPVASETR